MMKTCPFLDLCPPESTCAEHYAAVFEEHLARHEAECAAHIGDTTRNSDARPVIYSLRPASQGALEL